jgi:hypothetical protein
MSLDHLVGPREQRRRHGEAKRFCGLEATRVGIAVTHPRRAVRLAAPTRQHQSAKGLGAVCATAKPEAAAKRSARIRLQQASVPHCLLLPSKRIGRTKVRSVSGTAAGGGGNGAARVIRESASASSTAEPELLMI